MSDAEVMSLDLARGFRHAADLLPGEVSDHQFRIGGHRLRLQIVGTELAARMTWPFDHLRVPDDQAEPADLSIKLWDGAATGDERPVGDLRHGFEAATLLDDGVLATGRGGRLLGHQSPHASMILDLDGGVTHGWISSAAETSPFTLKPVLFGWHVSHDLLPVHAALIARDGKGIFLGGRQDSGKSTTALLCSRAGFTYLGDDFIGLAAPGLDGVVGHSLYNVARLEAGHSRRLPWLQSHRLGASDGSAKQVFSVMDVMPMQMGAKAPIRAVVLPRVMADAQTALRPADPGPSLLRIAPSTILQLPFVPPPQVLARLSHLIRSVPVYWLDLGTDFECIPRLLGGLLDDLPNP